MADIFGCHVKSLARLPLVNLKAAPSGMVMVLFTSGWVVAYRLLAWISTGSLGVRPCSLNSLRAM